MPTIRRAVPRKGAAPGPIRNMRVIKDAKPGSLLAKLRELETKLADNDTPEAEQQVVQELAGYLASIENPKPAAKAPRHQPAARVTQVAPAVSATQMRTLAGALGVRLTPEEAEKRAREATDRRRRETNAGGEGRAVDIPDQAKPTHIDNRLTSVTMFGPNGARLADSPIADAVLYNTVLERFIAAGRRPIVVAPAEWAKASGLSLAETQQAIQSLLRRNLLQLQPGRAGTVQMIAPTAV